MNGLNVMVNGLPGNVTRMLARHIVQTDDMVLVPYSLTGPEIEATHVDIEGQPIALIRPEDRGARIDGVKTDYPECICVDFTHPSAVNANAAFYCDQGLPFVMGTTGGDREALRRTVLQSSNAAVIAPNMAKQIVGLQAMMAYAAETFPGLFGGYTLTVRESHQQGKADTSGTAKAMVRYFNAMGVDFTDDQIHQERDPRVQQTQWGVPEVYLGGHGWHTYTLISADQTTRFEFTHNINGREIYAEGTLDALRFLARKLDQGCSGQVFSMIDVLRQV
ncbi:MAG: dihydrodipicolinate reductase [Desulfobacterales bacterium]|nr:dihydrodipicolinate reductase [Desulfobacterales bacterium]MDJ0853972.1 dihydrodipicolinate reductase [Desulfobacterales bacterium]MDJ0991152.1 dihydrodipicolinate reductase [Desulfobacterales bacterium]